MYTKVDKPPRYWKVLKQEPIFMDWRMDVANGAVHPLSVEEIEYTRITIGKMRLDGGYVGSDESKHNKDLLSSLEEHEAHALESFLKRPEVQWAVDNSLDGLYIKKEEDYANLLTLFSFSVFMKNKLVTFWRLKYSGQ